VSVTTDASARETRQRHLTQGQSAHEFSNQHRRQKSRHSAQCRRNQEWRVVQLGERRFRHDDEQQRRQRDIEQEEIHPGEAGFRQAPGLAAGKADEDQAEIRHCKIENVDHFQGIFSPVRYSGQEDKVNSSAGALASPPTMVYRQDMIKARTAKFQIGQIVRHRVFKFRGVIFDIDPEFNNTEEWWLSIPEDVRPHKDQPFYHLLAENSESEYVAYVSEQNLLPDDSGEPIRHSQVAEIFVKDKSGGYRPRNPSLN
jgi:heat shock protein HspQ